MSQECPPQTYTHTHTKINTHALALGERPTVWQNWAKLSPRAARGRCNLIWSANQSPWRWHQVPGLKSKGTEATGEAKAKMPKGQELGEE